MTKSGAAAPAGRRRGRCRDGLSPVRWPHAALVVLLLSCVRAQAGVATYRCDGDRPLKAWMTPREATIELDGQRWALRRVRDSREARFVNTRLGLTLSLRRSQAEWQRNGEPALLCKLLQPALQADALPAPRAASAPRH